MLEETIKGIFSMIPNNKGIINILEPAGGLKNGRTYRFLFKEFHVEISNYWSQRASYGYNFKLLIKAIIPLKARSSEYVFKKISDVFGK